MPVVQRSVRLVPKVLRGSGSEEGELDLVFNWAGKLWVVDCKDRRSTESKVDQLRTRYGLTAQAAHMQVKPYLSSVRRRARVAI